MIYNLSFFDLSDEYLRALREVEELPQAWIDSVRRSTYLPIISSKATPEEVFHIIQGVVTFLAPFDDEDFVILSGTPDVVFYLGVLIGTSNPLTRIICPLGSSTKQGFRISGFRQIFPIHCYQSDPLAKMRETPMISPS